MNPVQMDTEFRLRPYQRDCVDAIRSAHEEDESVLAELATGTGKTEIFVAYAQEFKRTLVVCPWLTLIEQAANKIESRTGTVPDIEQGAKWSSEGGLARSPYVVASKASLCKVSESRPRPRYERFRDIDLVICDEAHYAATKTYSDMIQHFRSRGAKILGVTATAKRHDGVAMSVAFDRCAYQYGMLDAIEDGWLVRPKVTCKQIESLDLSNVAESYTTAGTDFNLRELNEKLEDSAVLIEIAAATAESTRGKKTVVYCSSVAEAESVSGLLCDEHGIESAWICADKKLVPESTWREAMRRFHSGEITHICNVGQLTVGWDCPSLEAIVMARPTKSLPLYTQVMGRGTRALPGVVDFDGSDAAARRSAIEQSAKPNFACVDLVDNSREHKIVTAVDVLGGREDSEVIERAKENTDGCGEYDMAEALLRAAEELEVRRKNRRLRAEIAAQATATFSEVEVDPFGGRCGAILKRAAAQREPATRKQRRYLWVKGIKDVDGLHISKAQASRMIGQLVSGQSVSEVRRTNRI